MKKIARTTLGPWDQTFFDIDGRRVDPEDLIRLLETECNPYKTGSNGVIIYLKESEYQRLAEQYDEDREIT